MNELGTWYDRVEISEGEVRMTVGEKPHSELRERVALCREQIEASPYSHTIAAGWYADDVERLLEQLEEAEQAAQRNWDTHTEHVAEIIDSERKGMQALRDRIAELELAVSRIDAMVPDLERASPFQRKISEITQAVLTR